MAASPLTAPRPGSRRYANFDVRPLTANANVQKGGLAACVAGYYKPASGDPNEVVVGRFYATVNNTGGADGAKGAEIEFFRERQLFLLDNDAGAALAIADREHPCSILDDHTATALDSTKGAAAIVYDVTSEGVWVELMFPSSLEDDGPRIQSGTSTLVAGSKTITNVVISATSRIVVTMKDPGAGSIAAFAALDVPAGGRTAGPAATGQFVVNAIDNTKATIATAVCTFDYVIIG